MQLHAPVEPHLLRMRCNLIARSAHARSRGTDNEHMKYISSDKKKNPVRLSSIRLHSTYKVFQLCRVPLGPWDLQADRCPISFPSPLGRRLVYCIDIMLFSHLIADHWVSEIFCQVCVYEGIVYSTFCNPFRHKYPPIRDNLNACCGLS